MAEVLATTLPPAGWYRDPAARFDFRYWNGEAWTDHVRRDGVAAVDADLTAPVAQIFDDAETEVEAEVDVDMEVEEAIEVDEDLQAAEAEEPSADVGRRARWPLPVLAVAGGGAVLLALGALLPWAEAESAHASFSQIGLDGNGAITLLAGILVVLAIALMRPSPRAAGYVLALGAAALAVGIYQALDTSQKANDLVAHSSPDVSAGVGIGVWLTIGAAVVVLVGGAIALVSIRRA
jgi:hypothetical protein